MNFTRVSLLLAPFVFAIACGGAEPQPAAPVASATPPADTGAPPPAASTAAPTSGALPPFESLTSMDDKLARMKTVVKPTMAKVFQDHDAARYKEFGCPTCHGPKLGKTQDFLPKLDLSPDGFKKLMGEQPEVVKFMHEKVVPAMASAMGDQPYDMNTKQGFGCMGCHGAK